MRFSALSVILLAALLPACADKPAPPESTTQEPAGEPTPAAVDAISFEQSERRAAAAEKELKSMAAKMVAGEWEESHEWLAEPAQYFVGSDPDSQYSEVHVHRIQHEGSEQFETGATIEAKARNAEGDYVTIGFALHTVWRDEGEQLQLISAERRPVAIRHASSPALWFADRTEAVIGAQPAFQQHLAHGLDHWLGRVEAAHGIDAFIRNGMAVGDMNGDGHDDIYVCQPGGLPNRLFLQAGDGTVFEPQDSGTDYLDHTSAALFLDLDNDGDQDLALAMPAGIVLLENDGGGTFESRGTLRTDAADCHSLTATDFNLDGKLDLYITFALGTQYPGEEAGDFRFHDARDGGANQLFRGDGEWSFSEMTNFVGLGENNDRHSLAAAWCDYDLDGDPDLYIANDYGHNQLYVNKLEENSKGLFSIGEKAMGVEDFGAGMSVSWGDVDRDGRPDLYVGNMYSNAGGRMTGQSGYLGNSSNELLEIYRRFAKGNTLFRQQEQGGFEDRDPETAMGRWSWSSVFGDLDNDGWEDLFVANGYITGPKVDDL